MSMQGAARLCGIALIAALSGCAQGSGLAQISLLGSGPSADAVPDAAATTPETDDPHMPPVPDRNARRVKGGATKVAAASDGSPSQSGGLSLSGIANVKLFTATASNAPDTTQWEQAPIAVYTQLAQQIHACWLTPGSPKLTNHGFHADVAPGGSNTATIILFQKDPNGKRGLQAFRISIDGALTGSTVRAENRRLDKPLELSFKSDLVRWSQGKLDCHG